MFSWLKKHFIPHEGNDHRPHLLRGDTARGIVFMVLFFEASIFFASLVTFGNSVFMAAVLPAVLGNLTNVERENNHLSDLKPNAVLDEAAALKAHDMAEKGYFAHTSPEGKTPWYWLDKVGYDYEYAGENLAINFTDSKDVTEAWMNSPTHRANIEKAAYTEVGTGVATGMYEGRETIFVAQVYAKPVKASVAAPIEPAKPVEVVAVAPVVVTPVATNTQTSVLGAETVQATPAAVAASTIGFWDSLRASPRHTMNIILYILGGLVGTALILKLVISMRAHHVDLIANGLCVIAIIGAVYLANVFLFKNNLRITPAATFQAFDSVSK